GRRAERAEPRGDGEPPRLRGGDRRDGGRVPGDAGPPPGRPARGGRGGGGEAGKPAGGEVGGNEHSAGLKVVDRDSFPLVDLRVDWVESDPVGRLGELWARYPPEMDLYRLRAVHPPAAEARRQE